MLVDFTSSLYLGLRHAGDELRTWSSLTSGRPAALGEVPDSAGVASRLATLQNCERGTLAPSTLHVYWDLFGMMEPRRTALYVDAGSYPIARWGVERAVARGIRARCFRHHDANHLERQMRRDRHLGRAPLVVADGFCPACGRSAPLPSYLEAVRARGGGVLIDDTQALGIFGHSPEAAAPYGYGGGGTLRWHQLRTPEVLTASSLAKAFGAPVAVLAGNYSTIRAFEQRSETRVHCSPPSVASLRAAERALAINEQHGDRLRGRLWRLVRLFGCLLRRVGQRARGGLSPMQTLEPLPGHRMVCEHERLLREFGIRTILRQAETGGPRISLLITASHSVQHIARAIAAIACTASR